MQPKKYRYLIRLQYLGYRFHGWVDQPGVKTVQGVLNRCLRFTLGHTDFKTLGSSRTDAKVSALDFCMEVFAGQPIPDFEVFLLFFNQNLPSDIRAISIIETPSEDFNIINSDRYKEYIYLFSFGEKTHPFAAPFITNLQEPLDLEAMRRAALMFVGEHDLIRYCYKAKPETSGKREILFSDIEENTEFKANFFPEKSYAYRVRSAGFMRHQVRMMMGMLFLIGKCEASIEDLKETLDNPAGPPISYVAPAPGLFLYQTHFL